MVIDLLDALRFCCSIQTVSHTQRCLSRRHLFSRFSTWSRLADNNYALKYLSIMQVNFNYRIMQMAYSVSPKHVPAEGASR